MDDKPSHILKHLSHDLQALVKHYQQQAFSQKHFSDTLAFTEQLLSQFQKYPEPLTAFTILPFAKQNSVYLILTRCIHAALLGHSNKLNQTSSQQLICACVCISAQLKNNRKSPDKRILLALTRTQQDTWRSAYQLLPILAAHGKVNPAQLSRLNKEQITIYLAFQLADPNTDQLHLQMRQLARNLPRQYQQSLYALCHYPTMLPPGSFIKKQDQSVHLVLSILSNAYLTYQIQPSQDEPISKISPDTKLQLIAPPVIKSLAVMDRWWDTDWQQQITQSIKRLSPVSSSFRLDTPPDSLLRVQSELRKDTIDANKVTAAIETEPLFADHLQKSASQASRLNMDIKDVKHGLMMQGFERTSDLLMRHALLLRINQHGFPLQQSFVQFVQLRAQIAASLCIQVFGSVFAEEAKTLVTFASVGLFTLAELKSKQVWQTNGDSCFDISKLVKLHHPQQLNEHAIKLARAWHQSDLHIKAIQLHNRSPKSLQKQLQVAKWACILGVSLVLARRAWFVSAEKDAQTQAYMLEATKLLKISQLQFSELMQEAASSCGSYCMPKIPQQIAS